jgi:DNA-binding NarL/FixJ family response regulator
MSARLSLPAPQEYDPSHAVFRDLLSFRVREVLLVSSLYDSYILQEDGQLAESLDAEYHQLNLSYAPRITQVSTAAAALEILGVRPFDLVITMTRLGGMDVIRFGREVKARHPALPIVLLADNPPEANRVKAQNHPPCLDQAFVWRGNVSLFLAIIKFIEDRYNVERDTRLAGVRTIILIENSVRFYSSYLPMLYTELTKQTHALMADGVNSRQRLRRMKARAKILLAETFEEAWGLYREYQSSILGIISDARFPREGRSDPEAGLEFVSRIKAVDPDMPVLIQSSDETLAGRAQTLGAAFLYKHSPRLLDELHRFMQTSLGFGDFVFTLPDGLEVARVRDLAGMPQALREVPEESLRYHATRNHFSNWCMARTEFTLADRLRPVKITEFATTEELRFYLIDAFSRLWTDTRRGIVAEFSRGNFDETSGFARIGAGSMGGKGRGLGFINSLIWQLGEGDGLKAGRVFVPPAAVIGTEIFDAFLQINDLAALALSEATDDEIARAFLAASFPNAVMDDLRAFAARIRYPVAVRSSSLLEDSYDQPFAGIYRTYMLANNHPDPEIRLAELCSAIKLVYASTYFRNAKEYLRNTPHRSEEEKMAVVLQQLVGRSHGQYFYPDFAGVARSYNYYPVLDHVAEDGIAVVAFGFGRTVVEGGKAIRFSPGSPRSLPQFSSTTDILRNAQREFFALDLSRGPNIFHTDQDEGLVPLDLDVAEEHGTLGPVASVYSRDNDAVYDGVSRPGVRLVTFAPILKSGTYPLPEILSRLLALGEEAMSSPVEIEFAVNLHGSQGRPEFGVVQIRPMVVEVGTENLDEALRTIPAEDILCSSEQALGHGRIQDIADVVYVRPEAFDRAFTQAIAAEVGEINRRLQEEDRPYLLIGPGRWGTSDRWLGIPVEWRQIAGARAIIETDLDELPVTPSEGTHFFQNLTSFGIGYFTVHRRASGGWVDYAWLTEQPSLCETRFLRHLRLVAPLDLRIDGRTRRGVVLKQDHP